MFQFQDCKYGRHGCGSVSNSTDRLQMRTDHFGDFADFSSFENTASTMDGDANEEEITDGFAALRKTSESTL